MKMSRRMKVLERRNDQLQGANSRLEETVRTLLRLISDMTSIEIPAEVAATTEPAADAASSSSNAPAVDVAVLGAAWRRRNAEQAQLQQEVDRKRDLSNAQLQAQLAEVRQAGARRIRELEDKLAALTSAARARRHKEALQQQQQRAAGGDAGTGAGAGGAGVDDDRDGDAASAAVAVAPGSSSSSSTAGAAGGGGGGDGSDEAADELRMELQLQKKWAAEHEEELNEQVRRAVDSTPLFNTEFSTPIILTTRLHLRSKHYKQRQRCLRNSWVAHVALQLRRPRQELACGCSWMPRTRRCRPRVAR